MMPTASGYGIRKVLSSGNDNQQDINASSSLSSNKKRSTATNNGNDLTNSLPMSRAKSTPIHTHSGGSGITRVGKAPGSLGYAMRKVFSREEQSEWHQQEAEDLVHSDSLVGNRVSSRLVDNTIYREEEEQDEIGAELVLDETDLYTIPKEQHDNASVANAMLKERAGGNNKRSVGYTLRRFLSTPNHNQIDNKTSSLRRTPSYEPGYEEDAYYDETPLYNNTQHDGKSNLSDPIPLSQGISFRRKKSDLKKKSNKGMDDDNEEDLSTVAESEVIEVYNEKRKDYKKKKLFKRIGLVMFLLACAISGVTVHLLMSNNGEENNSHSKKVVIDVLLHEDDVRTSYSDDEVTDWASVDDPIDTADDGNNAISSEETQEENPLENIPASSEDDGLDPVEDEIVDTADKKPLEEVATVAVATSSPTTNPTTSQPTHRPSPDPMESYTKFYLMADCPYDDNERNNIMPSYIEGLSTDAEFLVHLGDTQYAKVDDCEEYAYREASDILKKSPIPTFVLPGDNDINDCDDHEHGEEMWTNYFKYIDKRWNHTFNLTRWGKLNESFSFLHKKVLYFGLNVIGGRPYSNSESNARHEEHLEMIHSILDGLDEGDFNVLVLLAHADPTCSSHHEDFFREFAEIAEELGKPTIHFHGDSHEYYEVEGGDYYVDNYMRISLDGESIAPPIKVEIDVTRKNPIKVSRRRSDLDVDCCKYGWPRHDDEL